MRNRLSYVTGVSLAIALFVTAGCRNDNDAYPDRPAPNSGPVPDNPAEHLNPSGPIGNGHAGGGGSGGHGAH